MSVSSRLSELAAVAAASVCVAYGGYLLVIGPASTYLTPEDVAGTVRSPSLVGTIPLGIGLVAFWAVAKRRTVGLWAAAGLALAFSLIFLFSYSLQFAGLAALLFVAAVVRTAFGRSSRQH